MHSFRRFLSYFAITSIEPELAGSQVKAFTKQVPLLYLILNANVLALAITHYATAPAFLAVVCPAALAFVCVYRLFAWVRARGDDYTAESAQVRLRSTYLFCIVLGILYTAWGLSLYPYGDAYAKSHVAFFMSTTTIGCVFCLMHLRPAALMLTVVVGAPFTIRFVATGEPVLTAIALNFALVAVAMIFILFIYHRDFTDLVYSQRRLAALSEQNFKMANRDSLTGLPNRRSFFTDFEAMMARDGGATFALGLIDLDGFKPVNDVFGHAAGDGVLIEVGERLRRVLGPEALVARLGGDEFGFILPRIGDSTQVLAKGTEICRAINLPVDLPNGTAQVAASVGFAVQSDGALTQNKLIERADYALYCAKSSKRGGPVIFSPQHQNAISAQGLIEQELRRAALRAEMDLHYQPIVDAAQGRIVAYEALARWDNPQLGRVNPCDFIAAAERTGLINQLTEVLFAKALLAAKTWPDHVELSFNLSVQDIASPAAIARLREMIGTSGLSPARIVFEITETALVNDFEQARDALLGLRSLGAKVALDDFGTGYSSLHYVHRLPLDTIKIDREFVADVTTDPSCRDIVKSIIDLCRNLHMKCIVEGVETAEQVGVLRNLGCRTMQGYYFGRPAINGSLPHVLPGSVETRPEPAAARCA